MKKTTKQMTDYLNINLMLDQNQAEKVFDSLTDVKEQITEGWDMPKVTIRYGKDIRCERVEMPYQVGATYMCYLLHIGIDDAGAIKKIA